MILNFPVEQRWNHKKTSWVAHRQVFNPREFDVVELFEDKMVKDFVTTRHYSGAYVAARRRFGLFRKAELVGAAVLSQPVHENTLLNAFRISRASDALELGRFVLLDEVGFNAESWLIARVKSCLKNDYAGIVSFADDHARTAETGSAVFVGHLGTCYQSAGFAFTGRGEPTTIYLLPDGTIFSKRAISKIRNGESGWLYASRRLERFGASAAPEAAHKRRQWLEFWLARLTRKQRHIGNLKYALELRPRMLRLKSLPYPKIKIAEAQPDIVSTAA